MPVQTLNGKIPQSFGHGEAPDRRIPDPWTTPLTIEDVVPEPPSPTGQYPDDIWAQINYSAMQGARSLNETDEIPTPTSATEQYPDDVWASVNYGTTQGWGLGTNDTDIPEPPSAIGQYPDDVWSSVTVETASPPENSSSPTSHTQGVPITLETSSSEHFLSFKEVDYADELGLSIDLSQMAVEPDGQVELNIQEIYRIIRVVAEADSGNVK